MFARGAAVEAVLSPLNRSTSSAELSPELRSLILASEVKVVVLASGGRHKLPPQSIKLTCGRSADLADFPKDSYFSVTTLTIFSEVSLANRLADGGRS